MKSIVSTQCVQRTQYMDAESWMRDVVAHPQKYGVSWPVRRAFASLLVELELADRQQLDLIERLTQELVRARGGAR